MAQSPGKSMGEVTRFAPSPTGLMHLGHAHAALFAARAAGPNGRFLLRIEDIDPERCRPEYDAFLLEDLAWLGLAWETPVRRQSEHLGDYRTALDRLAEIGVLYPCFCSRREIREEVARAGYAPHLTPMGPEGPLYPGTCRHLDPAERRARLAAGNPRALRLDVAAALAVTGPLTWRDRAAGEQMARPELLGDVVLGRRDVPASYHLAVTWDDALQEVTLVTRASDLFEATHTHRLLQALLGLPVPDWHHHGLLTNPAGARLSKRDGAIGLRDLRAAGKSPAEVRALAGFPD